mmetsp:Transcript_7554/g.11639  ORF Transcript_7554/g.11639 Transcript_7554/m.11639 type:complete len:238 (-) Transcript_7554:788-1501(-)
MSFFLHWWRGESFFFLIMIVKHKHKNKNIYKWFPLSLFQQDYISKSRIEEDKSVNSESIDMLDMVLFSFPAWDIFIERVLFALEISDKSESIEMLLPALLELLPNFILCDLVCDSLLKLGNSRKLLGLSAPGLPSSMIPWRELLVVVIMLAVSTDLNDLIQELAVLRVSIKWDRSSPYASAPSAWGAFSKNFATSAWYSSIERAMFPMAFGSNAPLLICSSSAFNIKPPSLSLPKTS